MNVNTIVFGGRYRVATYANGKVKTIHDPVRDRTLVIKDDTQFGKMLLAHIDQLFADAEKDDANA